MKLTMTAQAGRDFMPFVRRALRATERLLGEKCRLRELSVALVGDRRMSALHEQFMHLSGPTDVLTFPLDEVDVRGRAISGEVVVNVAEARRRAKEHGVAPKLEVLLYAIHGMLHLCGYDDRTERGYRVMHRMEDQLLTRLGLGPVFQLESTSKTRKRRGAGR